MNVQEYLHEHHLKYEVLPHEETWDAQRMAQRLHVSGSQVAKTVVLIANGGYRYLLAVVPASHYVDCDKVGEFLSGVAVRLAPEMDLARVCPDCELGAIPPFGSRYGLETILDESLATEKTIVFEGNNHREAIRMSYEDYYSLEHPLVGDIASKG